MRDSGNDSFLLLGTSDGSLAIVRAPIPGKWLKLPSFVRVFVLFDVFPLCKFLFDCSMWFICRGSVLTLSHSFVSPIPSLNNVL